MKTLSALVAFALFAHGSLSATLRPMPAHIDSSILTKARRAVPRYEPIEPEELKARLGTTPQEYKPEERHAGMVYFCRDENWGPPCFAYYPKLKYACSELGPELSGHVGSVFLEPGTICRFSSGVRPDGVCAPNKIFAWPETRDGWSDLLEEDVPGGQGKLGLETTHFTCAKCTNCVGQ